MSSSTTMDLKTYLQRIGAPEVTLGTFTPSLSALIELHRCHVLSIPFECFSAHIGEKVHLDCSWIYQKMVVGRRGGFCYEHNGLFWWVLRELGFRTRILSAQAKHIFTGDYGPPFDHMLMEVELEGRWWLCDVGYGGDFIPVFPLEDGAEENHVYGDFRLRVEDGQWYLEKRKDDDLWKVLFKFTREVRRYEDFQEMCEYHQTSPHSLLVCKTLATLQLPRGRIFLVGSKLISVEATEEDGIVKSVRELSEEEMPEVLKEKFGIILNCKLVPRDEGPPIPTNL